MQDRQKIIDLVKLAVFGSDVEKQEARYQVWQLAKDEGVVFASINDFYMARGKGELPLNFTVPAMNLRGMTFDLACSVFSVAKKHQVGAMIFEIARSEMSYTDQDPFEYTTVLMASALYEGWTGSLFIQGDHFQAKAESMGVPKQGEIKAIKELITKSISAGFYNIDIDMSTLVNLDASSVDEEQKPNIAYSLELAKFVRQTQPRGIEVSLGGEIGHIGGRNSTVADLDAFLSGFNKELPSDMVGMSKISVATGTAHGGVVLADGTLKDLAVDFNVLADTSRVCRERYQVGGAVQHGASTLPDEFFAHFPKSEAIEVHLATGFQNIQMDHPAFPKELLQEIYSWLDENKQNERKPEMTNAQFHYKLRKKAWGEFKKKTWEIASENREAIKDTLKERFEFLFKQLNVFNTKKMVDRFVKPVVIEKTKEDFAVKNDQQEEVLGLAD